MFNKTTVSKKTAVLLHIGTGSVGVAYVSLKETGPILHYAKRRHFEERGALTIDRYLSRVLWAATSGVTEMAMNKAYASSKEVHCFIPSILTSREIRKIKYTHYSFNVTQCLITDLVEKEIELIKKEDTTKNNKVLLEKKIIDIQLNGYSVDNPYNKKANEIVISMFISYTEKTIIEKLKNIIHQIFHMRTVYFHNTPLSLYSTVSMLFPKEENFTILNISGEVSDVITSVDRGLSQIISFPFGSNTFLRLLGGELGVYIREARGILGLYKNGELSDVAKEQVEKALLVIRGMWKESLRHLIREGNFYGGFPPRIFMSGDPTILTFLPEWFKESRKDLFNTDTNENFMVKELNTQILYKHMSKGGDASHDPLLVLFSIFTNYFK